MALPRGECTTSCSPPRGIRIRNLSNCRVAIHTPPGANKGHDTVNLQYSCGPVGCHLRRKVVEFAVSLITQRSVVQIHPLQSIVLSCERVPGTLQPSEFLGEFVQADGWARLPVTPLNLVQVSCGELF